MSSFVDLLVKLDRLDHLVRRAVTGKPEELAERLGMSRSRMFAMIKFLKEDMNAPIVYDEDRQSYVYTHPPKFYLGFERNKEDNDLNI